MSATSTVELKPLRQARAGDGDLIALFWSSIDGGPRVYTGSHGSIPRRRVRLTWTAEEAEQLGVDGMWAALVAAVEKRIAGRARRARRGGGR